MGPDNLIVSDSASMTSASCRTLQLLYYEHKIVCNSFAAAKL